MSWQKVGSHIRLLTFIFTKKKDSAKSSQVLMGCACLVLFPSFCTYEIDWFCTIAFLLTPSELRDTALQRQKGGSKSRPPSNRTSIGCEKFTSQITESSNTAMSSQILWFDTLWSPGYNGEVIRSFHIGHFPCKESCKENVRKIPYKIPYRDLTPKKTKLRSNPFVARLSSIISTDFATQFVGILFLVLCGHFAKSRFADFCESVCRSAKTALLKI